jgi:hypothetical protein
MDFWAAGDHFAILILNKVIVEGREKGKEDLLASTREFEYVKRTVGFMISYFAIRFLSE